MDLVQYRDPFVWRGRAGSPNKWLLTIGAGFPGVGGTALVYGSDDLRHWDYLHPMAVGDASVREPVWTGIMWECPDYYEDPTTGKGVLVLSAWDRGVQYVVASTGDVDATGTRLVPTNTFALDGGAFYAPQSFWDAKGRRIQFGWLRESRPAAVHGPAGWAGVMSLPRVLRVTPDGRLAGSPAPEVAALRRDHVPVFPSARTRHAVDLHEAHFELSLRFDAVGTGRSGAWVRCSPDGQEATFAGYDPAVGGLIIDRSQSSVDRVNSSTASLTPVVIPGGASFTVRIFGDGSVIEAFIEDEGGCIANIGDRIYPTRQDSLGMSVEGPTFVGGDAWLMADIWRSRT
jgi:beta-fructofuranosidase